MGQQPGEIHKSRNTAGILVGSMKNNSKEYTPDTPEKVAHQAELFSNRLSKQYKVLRKWARKNRISSYRLYDRDIPEIPLACDIYTFLPPDVTDKLSAILYFNEQNAAISKNDASAVNVLSDELSRTYVHLYLYERPYEKPEKEENVWLDSMANVVSNVLNIAKDHVIIKTRKRQTGTEEGRNGQYEKIESQRKITGTVFEQGQIFQVNLSDYIDTGLFFDHRPLRAMVRASCAGKSVLNLFCYTGSFSVYAAEGRAKRIESVDMSKTYLEWCQSNMCLNDFASDVKYIYTRQDAVGFLNQKNAEVANAEGTNRFDIIVLDPPTFSNSKRTDTSLDINRDWSDLVTKCLNILTPKGVLYFSTNSRRLSFDENLLPHNSDGTPIYSAKDITEKTIPEDYRNNKIHRAWMISKR